MNDVCVCLTALVIFCTYLRMRYLNYVFDQNVILYLHKMSKPSSIIVFQYKCTNTKCIQYVIYNV